MTVKELYEKVVNGIIISDIELQRAIVYDADKQALVIDSLYHGIPLPAFVSNELRLSRSLNKGIYSMRVKHGKITLMIVICSK